VSATNRSAERLALDDYPTPRWCVHRLLEVYELRGGLWLEPCAGAGSILRAVAEVRSDVLWQANDLNPDHYRTLGRRDDVRLVMGDDAREIVVHPEVVVAITNPPFGPSLDILRHLLDAGVRLPIFLQRLNWAAGPRRELFRALKPSSLVLPDRPSFMDLYEVEKPDVLKAQTDSIEYAWFVFDGRGEFRVLGDTPSEVRAAEIEEGRASGLRPRRAAKPKRVKEAA